MPGAVTHRTDELADLPGRLQRHCVAVAGDEIARRREARDLDLQALHRRIHIAHRASRRTLLAHDVPGFERLAQLELDAARGEIAVLGKTEFKVGGEPIRLEFETFPPHLLDHIRKVPFYEVRHHE